MDSSSCSRTLRMCLYFVQSDKQVKDDTWSDCGKRGVAGWFTVQGKQTNDMRRGVHESLKIQEACKSVMLSVSIQPAVNNSLVSCNTPFLYLSVKPRKGDALLFFSLKPSAEPDGFSLHAGCPVIEGEKWSATKWIHVRPFTEMVSMDSSVSNEGNECKDENTLCADWALSGECVNNPMFMHRHCKRSCGKCYS